MTPSLHQSSKVHLIWTHDLSIATSEPMIHPRPSSLPHFHQPFLDRWASFLPTATTTGTSSFLFRKSYTSNQPNPPFQFQLSTYCQDRDRSLSLHGSHKHTFRLFLTHYSRLLFFRPRELGTRLLKTPWLSVSVCLILGKLRRRGKRAFDGIDEDRD